jgi:hypothetical protein
MKYKIEFSGQAELMFAMMAKLLPDELNVHVEEIPELPETHSSRVAQLVSNHQKLVAPNSSHSTRKEHFKHPTGKTVQDFVIEFLKSRPSATWAEMSKYTVTIGYNKSSINNAVTRLVYKKVVEKVAPGVYRLTKKSHEK